MEKNCVQQYYLSEDIFDLSNNSFFYTNDLLLIF